MGAPTETVMRCHACGSEIYKTDVAKDDTCSCGADLHSCVNCRHFDPSATFECRKPIEERISKKTKRNDCDLYEPKLVQEFESGPRKDDDARAAFDNLFDL